MLLQSQSLALNIPHLLLLLRADFNLDYIEVFFAKISWASLKLAKGIDVNRREGAC